MPLLELRHLLPHTTNKLICLYCLQFSHNDNDTQGISGLTQESNCKIKSIRSARFKIARLKQHPAISSGDKFAKINTFELLLAYILKVSSQIHASHIE